jgi:hypothetical protein
MRPFKLSFHHFVTLFRVCVLNTAARRCQCESVGDCISFWLAVGKREKGLDPQTPYFIEDMDGFQFPAEKMPDEMGQEAPTLLGGLFR